MTTNICPCGTEILPTGKRGRPSTRCESCKATQPVRTTHTGDTYEATCVGCSATFTHPIRRGRPQTKCETCRATPIERKPLASPTYRCQVCDGHVFIIDDSHDTEPFDIWSHLEDTGCDDPTPILVNDTSTEFVPSPVELLTIGAAVHVQDESGTFVIRGRGQDGSVTVYGGGKVSVEFPYGIDAMWRSFRPERLVLA